MRKFKDKWAAAFWRCVEYFSLLLFAFIAIVPLYSCVITALKTDEEYYATSVMKFPMNWLNLRNFYDAWQQSGMAIAFKNTVIILVIVMLGSVMIGSMIAYVLNRFKFFGNHIVRNMFLFAALIPGIAMQIPIYKMMSTLGLNGSLIGYITLLMGTDVIAIYIFIQFFEKIPISLDESASIDGASYISTFFRILLPALKPAINTVLILKGISVYNEYYCANLYINRPATRSLTLALYSFSGPVLSKYNLICAGVIITLLPALITFILFQKQIYNGLILGAEKG